MVTSKGKTFENRILLNYSKILLPQLFTKEKMMAATISR